MLRIESENQFIKNYLGLSDARQITKHGRELVKGTFAYAGFELKNAVKNLINEIIKVFTK